MSKIEKISIEEILEKARSYIEDEEQLAIIKKAYLFALEKHDGQYRKSGEVVIDEEKFVENFIRRFAESADLSQRYEIEIYDINTNPPKVSLKVSSTQDTTATGEVVEFNIVNNIDAILETKF